jgi:hypothetical protein
MKLFKWYYRHAEGMATEFYFYPYKVKDNEQVYGIIFGDRTWIEWFNIGSVDTNFIDTKLSPIYPSMSYQQLYRTAIMRAFVDVKV